MRSHKFFADNERDRSVAAVTEQDQAGVVAAAAVSGEDRELRGICCHGVFPRAAGRLDSVLCSNSRPFPEPGTALNHLWPGVLATGGTDGR